MKKEKVKANTSNNVVSVEVTQKELIECADFGDITSMLSRKVGYSVKIEAYTYQPQSGNTIYEVTKI